MKNKVIISSILTIALCFSLIAGSTFALFSSESTVNIAVNSGEVKVVAAIEDIKTSSNGVEQADGAFANGGFAKFDAGKLTIANITPGDKVEFTITGKNESTVSALYYYSITSTGDLDLVEGLNITIADVEYDNLSSYRSAWNALLPGADIASVKMTIELPWEAGNEYQNLSAGFDVLVYAVQGNAGYTGGEEVNYFDFWDGKTADTSWHDEMVATGADEVTFTKASELAGLADLVNAGETFTGKTFTLGADLDLGAVDENGNPVSFEAIGDSRDPFEGTFDGNGHTISNLYQSGWDFGYEWGSYGTVGLFGSVNNATVKNVTISGYAASIEGGDIGGITGSAEGTCVFENITIEDSGFGTYNNGIGGIIGWSGAGHYTFKNIKISEDVILGGLWGSFDSSVGGIVGQAEPGATYIFENVDIACQLDVFNDCTASYDYYNYRMCGMIIGRLEETTTIEGSNYPDVTKYNIVCNNVTVTYGEWADYHYCRTNGQRAKRVEAGYAYDGVAADYDHSVCDLHHMECIPFDQIFGGDQYAVKGLKTYDGVNVVYNNDHQ